MNRILLAILLLFHIANVQAQKNSPEIEEQFRSLKWLEGTWERINLKPGLTASESWRMEAPYKLIGLGVTMKGNDTAFLEKIQIRIKGNNLYYIADVRENQAPVDFKFTSLSASGFVCENPEHDFPKKIEYRLNGSNLAVIISANGKSQDYLFVKK
jgi:Domain of unknown function (DUF6265)